MVPGTFGVNDFEFFRPVGLVDRAKSIDRSSKINKNQRFQRMQQLEKKIKISKKVFAELYPIANFTPTSDPVRNHCACNNQSLMVFFWHGRLWKHIARVRVELSGCVNI